jgi:hypothetical protein
MGLARARQDRDMAPAFWRARKLFSIGSIRS